MEPPKAKAYCRSSIERALYRADSCGCASVEFCIDGRTASPKSGMSIVSDYRWDDADGKLFGVFAHAREGLLSGIDLWSIDGHATADNPPNLSQLRPMNK